MREIIRPKDFPTNMRLLLQPIGTSEVLHRFRSKEEREREGKNKNEETKGIRRYKKQKEESMKKMREEKED